MPFTDFLIAVDQLVNTIVGGKADETISARSWRLRNESKIWWCLYKIIDLLFFKQKMHCYNAYLSELNKKQLPNEYSKKEDENAFTNSE